MKKRKNERSGGVCPFLARQRPSVTQGKIVAICPWADVKLITINPVVGCQVKR